MGRPVETFQYTVGHEANLAGTAIKGASNAAERDIVNDPASLQDMIDYNKDHPGDLYRAGTGGKSWRLLGRQAALNAFGENPIKPLDGQPAPEFPLRYSEFVPPDSIAHRNTRVKDYIKVLDGLYVESLAEWVRIILEREKLMGGNLPLAIKSVTQSSSNVTDINSTTFSFLREFAKAKDRLGEPIIPIIS